MGRGGGISVTTWITMIIALIALPAGPLPAQAQFSKGNGDLRVMTYNVDEGTDFIEVAAAQTLTQFLLAVGRTITQVRATDPPSRMQAVAKQIIAAAPTLVSLQELDQWSTGPFDPVTQKCGAVATEFDMQQELTNALMAKGAAYIIVDERMQVQIPPTPGLLANGQFLCVAVTNHVAILARTDLGSQFALSNLQSGQYDAKVFFNSPQGPFPSPRAWVSVDALFHGKPFRFISTHLESDDATVRQAQGGELRAGPANTALPVIIAMDSNAQAAPLPQDLTYVDFITAGYSDAWSEIFPAAPGFTCCQAQLVNNVASQLSRRIDLILTIGSVGAQNIALFGANQASKTPDGLWPSDHAGVGAQLVVEAAE
jgi:endonuclease/exonuclease/phosphatase family metal-dependent hydrolase